MSNVQEQEQESVSEQIIALEDARLQISDLVQLQTCTGGRDVRYSVRLIGLAKGGSILVTTPKEDGKYLLIREGQAFVLRAFSGKNAYAFATQVIKSTSTPYPYLHLAYPREIRSLVVRKGARASVNLVCAITRCDDRPTQAAGVLLNISVGGALLATKTPVAEKDQRLQIKFKVKVNGIEAFLEIDAIVRIVNIDRSGETSTPFQYGIQFADVPPEQSVPLLAFVYQELLAQSHGH